MLLLIARFHRNSILLRLESTIHVGEIASFGKKQKLMKTTYILLMPSLILLSCGRPSNAKSSDSESAKSVTKMADSSGSRIQTTGTKKLPADFAYLKDMYSSDYFPDRLVDKVRDAIKELVIYLESGTHTKPEIQAQLDKMTGRINELQDDFMANGSEIETEARESIAMTVKNILEYFEVNIDIEEAIRARDW